MGMPSRTGEIIMLTHDLEVAIRSLEDQPLNALKEAWEKAFGAPPRGIGGKLMTRALAHELQVKALGGLKPRLLKKLIAHGSRQAAGTKPDKMKLPPGTRLIREWQGASQVVDVVPDGLRWNNETYSSLSAVARAITGTRWNGLLFFGLKKRGD